MTVSVGARPGVRSRESLGDTPVVSVVMPAFNAEAWIETAIESVLAQTLPQWELIVVNDGSTDATEAVVRRFDDPRIQIIRQENRGAGHARNTGFRVSRGRYVSLLDADDWYEPPFLERAAAFLDENPVCSLVATNYRYINYKGETHLGCRPGEIMDRPGDGVIPDFFRATMRNRCFPITCGAMFRRERIPELGEFDPTLTSDEDHDFWTRWAMKSRFGYIDEPLSCYRMYTPGSNRKDLPASIRARVEFWRKIVALESEDLPFWSSYAECRSFYLFRLTALAVAAGCIDDARQVSAFWPASPGHVHWWLGKGLAALPKYCLRAMHTVLGRTEMVRFRQGKVAQFETDED